MTQRDAIAHAAHLAIDVIASRIVIDPVAVADIEPIVGTVPPDRVLYEPREDLPEARVELPGINLVSDSCNDVGTVTRPIAAGTIEVIFLDNSTSGARMPARRLQWTQRLRLKPASLLQHEMLADDRCGVKLGPSLEGPNVRFRQVRTLLRELAHIAHAQTRPALPPSRAYRVLPR
jgi:hypothetical protein